MPGRSLTRHSKVGCCTDDDEFDLPLSFERSSARKWVSVGSVGGYGRDKLKKGPDRARGGRLVRSKGESSKASHEQHTSKAKSGTCDKRCHRGKSAYEEVEQAALSSSKGQTTKEERRRRKADDLELGAVQHGTMADEAGEKEQPLMPWKVRLQAGSIIAVFVLVYFAVTRGRARLDMPRIIIAQTLPQHDAHAPVTINMQKERLHNVSAYSSFSGAFQLLQSNGRIPASWAEPAQSVTAGGPFAEDLQLAETQEQGTNRRQPFSQMTNGWKDRPSGTSTSVSGPLSERKAPTGHLTSTLCRSMMRDKTHLFRRMWAAAGWTKMTNSQHRPDCWNVKRETIKWERHTMWDLEPQDNKTFFAETLQGRYCTMSEQLGGIRSNSFSKPNSVLFGFKEAVDDFCVSELGGWEKARGLDHAARCAKANINLLSLSGDRVPWNVCRTLEQLTCVAKRMIPGQEGHYIKFASPPGRLDPTGASGKPLAKCCGWVPTLNVPGGKFAYTTDDLVFLKTCLLNEMCSNGAELFSLEVGEPFQCDFSEEGFKALQDVLLRGWVEPPDSTQCTGAKSCFERVPDHTGNTRTCNDCWRINDGIKGDCSTLPGCHSNLCAFCTNPEQQ